MEAMKLEETLQQLVARQDKLAALLERREQKGKDPWDKFSALSSFLSTVVIAFIGSVFTFVYNSKESARTALLKEQEVRISRIQTLEKFIPHFAKSEQEKRLAILAISSLGDTELATKLASLYPSEGTIDALKTIAASGQQSERDMATNALQRIFEGQRRAVVQVIGAHGSTASGGIVTSDGHIITADYVANVSEDTSIRVITADDKTHKAAVIGTDEQRGLAVLKIEGSNYPTLQLGETRAQNGDSVLAIGTRGRLSLEPATGIVRGMTERFVEVAFDGQVTGFGGGPVLNANGHVIATVHSVKPSGLERIDECVRSDVISQYLKDLKINLVK